MGSVNEQTTEIEISFSYDPGTETNLHRSVIENLERELLFDVLEKVKGNQSRAAKILGKTRGWLRGKIAKYGITIVPYVGIVR